jgi:hypothetical protein
LKAEENVLEEIEEDVDTEDIEQQLEENIKVPTIKERVLNYFRF